jgi:hypothetical protein
MSKEKDPQITKIQWEDLGEWTRGLGIEICAICEGLFHEHWTLF